MMARTAQINNLCRGITGHVEQPDNTGGLMVLPEGKRDLRIYTHSTPG